MNILYFDCFSGISGDMTLGALLDIDLSNFDYLVSQLKTLNVGGWSINMERRNKNGINANYIKVILGGGHEHHHEHRNYQDILHIIKHGGITENAKKSAANIFRRIAAAEAKIHGSEIDKVNFHEVGAVDSIIDVVGAAVLLDLLAEKNKIEKICCSVINDGYGFTHCQHGQIPVPAPAVTEIFADAKVKTRQINVPKELVTPTGAAIIAEMADISDIADIADMTGSFGGMPEMTALKTGYGAGTRDLDIPNVLRVILGKTGEIGEIRGTDSDKKSSGGGCASENITVIETNIDDCSPEIIAHTMEKLFKAGANDVFFTPIYMKKNRPAIKFTVLCKGESAEKLSKIIFSETTTIGVRIREEKRIILERKSGFVGTIYGDLKVKEIDFDGEIKKIPEYEDAKKLAENADVPLYKIYECIKNI